MKRYDTRKLTTLAILTALIIVLQLLSALLTRFVPALPVSITLTLVPIVVGAALYGAGAGAYLGGVFGLVVLIFCITALDLGGNMLWNAGPLMCALICLVKGVAAGAHAGATYRALADKNAVVGAILAGIVAPVTNTAIFIVAVLAFFRETLTLWAGGTDLMTYVILGLAGINFLLELVVNLVLAPIIVRIINARQK